MVKVFEPVGLVWLWTLDDERAEADGSAEPRETKACLCAEH